MPHTNRVPPALMSAVPDRKGLLKGKDRGIVVAIYWTNEIGHWFAIGF